MVDPRIELILSEIEPDASVLDIGCVNHDANGETSGDWLHKHLYTKAKYVLGIDILEEECQVLRDKGYNVIQGNAEQFDFDKKFDVIIAGELIEHLSNQGKFLQTCRDCLNKNGKLILTTPNVFCAINILSVIFKGESTVHEQHTCWFDKKTLAQLIKSNGWEIVKSGYICAKTSSKGSSLINFLSTIGFKELGGIGLFVVCKIREDVK